MNTRNTNLLDKVALWTKEVQAARKAATARDPATGDSPRDFATLYATWLGIFKDEPLPIAWMPDEKTVAAANITALVKELDHASYRDLHKWSISNKEKFWEMTITRLGIKFKRTFDSILDLSKGIEDPSWLPGAEMNITDSCFLADPEQTAIISGSEDQAGLRKISYGELRQMVDALACDLLQKGFEAGDRIAIYMPLSLESIVAYLAVVRAGLIVVSVADSYSPQELSQRLTLTAAKGIITCKGYTYKGKKVDIAEKVRAATAITTILLPDSGLPSSAACLSPATFPSYSAKPDHITNILFSSGTTSEPKAIPFTHLSPIKCASDGYYHFDIKKSDVVTWTTGMGWMMAPWLIYAVFLNKATLAVYSGAATQPDFAEFVGEAGVTILGTVPSIMRSWRNNKFGELLAPHPGSQPHKQHTGKPDWSKVRIFGSTGEQSNAEDCFFLMSLANFRAPIIEYCGGTEIAGAYITGTIVQQASPATFTSPALGLDLYLMDQEGRPVKEGQTGEIYIIPPSIGLSQQLLNGHHLQEYYQGVPKGPEGEKLRRHGDSFLTIEKLGNTFFRSAGRKDDIMNLGGIKISPREIEKVINQHPLVLESAAFSVPLDHKGPEQLVVCYTMNQESRQHLLKAELQTLLRQNLSPLFQISAIIRLDKLPQTPSGKLMRNRLRKQFLEREFT